MTAKATHTWFRKTVLAVAATFVLGGCVAPAYARDWNDGDGWRRHEGRDHERREHEWREHEWREHHGYYNNYNSYYYQPPAYAPAPSYGWYR